MIHIHHSNRTERLAAGLAAVLAEPLADPFQAEQVVVPHAGMGRWLAFELARAHGICARVQFPLPARFIWEALRSTAAALFESHGFEPERLAWRLLALLDECRDLKPVADYLEGADAAQGYELAERLAAVFDQYLVYRPDWIRAWEAGREDHWQAVLWRRLVARYGRGHWVAAHEAFDAALAGGAPLEGLPPRVCLFAVPALSPSYLQVLERLAGRMDVHLFQLNPCRQYWGQIVAEKDLARRPEEPYLEVGNRLLASLGKQGRDYLDMLLELGGGGREDFDPPAGAGMLAALQADLLDLVDRGGPEQPPLPLAPQDRSIQVHACHGPMRELEVLHDQLLALFEELPGLAPGEVLVLTPDIEAYAPYIDAVFGAASQAGVPAVPYSIADRSLGSESALAAALLRLLDLPRSRFEAETVMALLDCAALARRFRIAAADLPRLRHWVRESGIRWGVDAAQRAALGLPATGANTWRAGLERLLLGYALAAGEEALFQGILPYDEVEGAEARLAGRLASFCEALFALGEELAGERPVAEWAARLGRLLERFFAVTEEEEPELAELRRALERLQALAGEAGFSAPVALDLIRAHLQAVLGGAAAPGRFLAGGVTFCGLVPMRSIPFRVLCLVGMNDGAFPRSRRRLGFDRLAADPPRRGDRSRRDDDRYLFLEALISARERLYISYVGQDIRDNSERPPSVLVSELLDELERSFTASGGSVREQVLVRHPLQAFSRRYFAGRPPLFSYSDTLCRALQQADAGRREPLPLVARDLPPPEADFRQVDLDHLIRFFQHPARWFLQRRLGLYLDRAEETLEGEEPFDLAYPWNHELPRRLLEVSLAGASAAHARDLFRAQGILPHARVGEVRFAQCREAVEGFAEQVRARRPAAFLEPPAVDLALGDLRLSATLDALSAEGLFGYEPAALKPRDRLALWLRHLTLNAAAPPGVARRSLWLTPQGGVELPPLDDAAEELTRLLEIYWSGLHRPLRFFPKSSETYVLRTLKQLPEALEKAREVWLGSDRSAGECSDPYHRLCWRGLDVLDAEFMTLSETVLGRPLALMAGRAF